MFYINVIQNTYICTIINDYSVCKTLIIGTMPRKKKQRISIEEIKKRTPKIIFYTDKMKINLKTMSSLDFWFNKYPNGKFIVND